MKQQLIGQFVELRGGRVLADLDGALDLLHGPATETLHLQRIFETLTEHRFGHAGDDAPQLRGRRHGGALPQVLGDLAETRHGGADIVILEPLQHRLLSRRQQLRGGHTRGPRIAAARQGQLDTD